MSNTETICAISTASGTGAVAIIRLSGERAINIAKEIIDFRNRKDGFKHNTIVLGTIKKDNEFIDEVLVSTFVSPHSYTGEDMVEINCHGSSYIQQQILQLLVKHGARPANPGEFTQRAFLNKKLDLSQAEGVADLIASCSKASHNIAAKQMRGGFSKEISILRHKLLEFSSLIELELDFGEEDVEFADRQKLLDLINEIQEKVKSLINSFNLGNVIKNGIPVAIVGNTNVGKSTLLNLLVNEQKAIVSDIPGTTRDSIEDIVNIKGVNFRFIDTAGLRHSKDAIENIGIDRTYENIKKASIVLVLLEPTDDYQLILDKVKKAKSEQTHTFIVANKIDIYDKNKLEEVFAGVKDDITYISAKYNKNVDMLISKIMNVVNLEQVEGNEFIVSNIRHKLALQNTSEAIDRIIAGIKSNLSGDFLAMDIREAIHYLGEITGEISTDEILGNIFSNFCIGK